jgi:hypothetical protein
MDFVTDNLGIALNYAELWPVLLLAGITDEGRL